MKDIKLLLYKIIIGLLIIAPQLIFASEADTLKSPSDFYIASTKGEGSFDDAESYYLKAIEIYRDKDCQGRFLSQVYITDYYRYKKIIDKSLKHLDTVNLLLNECEISNNFILSEYYKINASVLDVINKRDKALESYTKAVDLLTQNGDTLPYAAMALYKKGLILQVKLLSDSAEIYYEAAWHYMQKLYVQPNVYHLIILNSLADIYQVNVKLDKAIEANEKLIKISGDYKIMQDWYASVSNINLGSIYYHMDELDKAELAYRHALNELNDKYAIYRTRKASVLYNIGLVYHARGEYKHALQYYKSALAYEEDIMKGTKSSVLLNMADVYYHLDSIDMAGSYYEMSIDTVIKYFGENTTKSAKTMLAAAGFYNSTKSERDILPLLKHAYKIYVEQDADHPRAALCRIKLGDYYKDQNADSALYFYNEGLEEYPPLRSLLPGDTINLLLNHEVNMELINLMQKKSLLFFQMAEKRKDNQKKVELLKEALATIDTTISLFERYRNSLSQESSRLFINNHFKDLIHTAVMTCRLLMHHQGEHTYKYQLYSFIEKYKAAVLSNEIAQTSTLYDEDIKDSLFLLEKRYRKDIAALQNYLYNLESGTENNSLASIAREQLIDLYKKHEGIHKRIAQKFPAFTATEFQQSNIDVESLQLELSADECLVNYFVSDTCLVSCLVSKNDFKVNFQSIDENFYESVEEVSVQTRNPGDISYERKDLIPYIRNLSELSNSLLDTSFMKNLNQVIIIPDAYLSVIPFGILLSHTPDELNTLTDLPYLAKTYTISYDYSAGLYLKNLHKEKKVIPRVGGFAPVYNYPTEGNLPALTDSPQEIVDIARYFDVKSFFRYQATEEQFKQEQDHFSILHLAMHTSIDSANPSFTSLIFAPDTISNADHLLNVLEIYNMRIAAGLSVLSGCNSGFGKLSPGEGLLSLARAFYLAGSNSIVMNLWQVEDKVSKQIFDRFYFHLSEDVSRGEALRLAKVDFLKNADPRFHHPHYWGGFVLIGQKSAFLSSFGQRQIILLLGIALSIVIVLIIVRKTVKKQAR